MSGGSTALLAVAVLLWYLSHSAYVERLAAVEKEHLGIHVLVHSILFFCATCVWQYSSGNLSLKSFVSSPSPWTIVASGCHTVGFVMAIIGIWHLGGATTQMVKLLEPIFVLVILQMRQNAKSLTSGQVVGSFVVSGTVAARLILSSTFSMPDFLLSIAISIFFPLRNTVWEEAMALHAAGVSLCMALLFYSHYALYTHDAGSLTMEVLAPAALFGCYQLSSLVVLHYAQPQLHATLNIGKRCCVLLAVFALTEQFDRVKLVVYATALLGSALISWKAHWKGSLGGFVCVLFLLLLFSKESSSAFGLAPAIATRGVGLLRGSISNLPVHNQLMVTSVNTTAVAPAPATFAIPYTPKVYVPDGYTETDLVSTPNLTLKDACKRNYGGNVGNMIWMYGASSLLHTEKNSLVQGSAWTIRDAFRMQGPPALLLLPVANIFVFKIPEWITEFVSMAKTNIMVGAGSQLYFYEENHYPDVGEVIEKPEMVTRSLPDNVQEDLHKIADRSLLIGVRGQYTQNVLGQYESRAIKGLGCPSLMLSDDPKLGQTIAKNRESLLNSRDPSSLKFLINLPVNYSPNMMKILHGLTVRHPRSVVVLQDPRDEHVLKVAAGNGMKFANTVWFNRFSDWRSFACEADGSIGARIHGSMVAVACGKPVLIISPDRRVQELAEIMRLPHRVAMSPDLHVNMTHRDLFSLRVPPAAEFDETRAKFASIYIETIRKAGAYPSARLCVIAGRSKSDCDKEVDAPN